jgi:hypothetical protein
MADGRCVLRSRHVATLAYAEMTASLPERADELLLLPAIDALIEREAQPAPCFPLLNDMFVERGTKDDHLFPNYEIIVERERVPQPVFPLLNEMFVERGAISDWHLLHDLHYKAESLPLGPRFWKLTLYGETIGVLVTANPKGLLKERHVVFPKMKPGNDTKMSNTMRPDAVVVSI